MCREERDRQARLTIANETDRNLFVEAGAGSGKTTMLVKRMVRMVEQGVDINRICAITFTKAAAGEFYERFQKLLIARSREDYLDTEEGRSEQYLPAPDAASRERCADALRNFDLCFMGTIDSFCSMVVSEHPDEAGVISDAKHVTAEEEMLVYRKIYVAVRNREYGDELFEASERYREVIRQKDEYEIFCLLMRLLMEHRNLHMNYPAYTGADIDTEFLLQKQQAQQCVEWLIENRDLISSLGKNRENVMSRINDHRANIYRRWSTDYSSVIWSLTELTKLSYVYRFPDGPEKEFLQGLKSGLLVRMRDIQFNAAADLVRRCVPVAEAYFRDNGLMTFYDYLLTLRNMLAEDAKSGGRLIDYISRRHSYFLIDEFQDTNPLQAEICFYLAAQTVREKWYECVPRPGSVFIVGDPKQSIYRFRNADVDSFNRVKGLFGEDDVVELTRNFRSTSRLCSYFNGRFNELLGDLFEGRDIPEPEDRPGETTGIYGYLTKKEEDPGHIADIITSLIDNPRYRILDSETKQPRLLTYKDIMVITYSKDNLTPIMNHLDLCGIPYRVEGQVLFGYCEALVEISCIYSAVTETRDNLALIRALTGKVFRLTDKQLMKFVDKGGVISIAKERDEIREAGDPDCDKVCDAMDRMKDYLFRSKSMSPASLFSYIMDTTEIYRYTGTDNMEVLCYTIELLRTAGNNGTVTTHREASEYLRELISGSSDEERCLSLLDNPNRVHMANLHKLKGLESPVVILAYSWEVDPNCSFRADYTDPDDPQGYLLGSIKGGKEVDYYEYIKSSSFADELALENRALASEGGRLVYVAATRARNFLIFADGHPDIDRYKYYYKNNRWAPLRDAGIALFDVEQRAQIHPAGQTLDIDKLYSDAGCILDDSKDPLKATYDYRIPSKLHHSKVTTEQENGDNGDDRSEEDDPESGSGDSASLMGTMVHRLMEVIVSTGNKADLVRTAREIVSEYNDPDVFPDGGDIEQKLINIGQTMRNGGFKQDGALADDILPVILGAYETYCEVPFCYMKGDVLWSGVIDLLIRNDSGWHIIDYKTNRNGKGLDEVYEEQMNAYIEAFKKTTGNDADAHTYHIETGLVT